MLGWPKPDCEFFRDILVTPRLVPILTHLLGAGKKLQTCTSYQLINNLLLPNQPFKLNYQDIDWTIPHF